MKLQNYSVSRRTVNALRLRSGKRSYLLTTQAPGGITVIMESTIRHWSACDTVAELRRELRFYQIYLRREFLNS